jgi:hypothetical protein
MRPDENGYSDWYLLDDLEAAFPEYKGQIRGNGSAMFNRGRGVGKLYVCEKEQEGGRNVAVRLAGYCQDSRSNSVPASVRRVIIVPQARCSLCRNSKNLECDHADGRKDTSNQVDDTDPREYQALCKNCNIMKRSACNACAKTGDRYDARPHGFRKGWWVGGKRYQPASLGCEGCFWHSPIRFIRESCS